MFEWVLYKIHPQPIKVFIEIGKNQEENINLIMLITFGFNIYHTPFPKGNISPQFKYGVYSFYFLIPVTLLSVPY